MSHSTQLEFHPNADSLNDFVEHALPEPERQEILAHLAGCSRCRHVIYFARETPSVLETPMPAAVPAPKAALPRDSWFKSWRFAWASVAACAAMIALAMFIYVRHRAPAPEIAKVVSPAGGSISNSSLPERTQAEAPHSPVQPAPTESMAVNSPSAPSSALSNELSQQVAPSVAVQGQDVPEHPPMAEPRGEATTPSGVPEVEGGAAQGQSESAVAGLAPLSTEAAVTLGQTPAEVIASNGLPKTIEDLDNKSVYVYPDKRITFVDGRASEIESSIASQHPLPAAGTAASARSARSNGSTAAEHGFLKIQTPEGSAAQNGDASAIATPDRTASAKVALGETPDEVIAINGRPKVIATLINRSLYFYPDMKITFVDGKASEIEAVSAVASRHSQAVPEMGPEMNSSTTTSHGPTKSGAHSAAPASRPAPKPQSHPR